MAITRVQASKICNSAEMELVGMSLGDTLKSLSAVQLRGKVKRARTLRDKFADQFKRQTLATRNTTGTKRGNSGAANARTETKLQLFDEVLKRFETRSAQVEAQAARAAAAAAKLAGKTAVKLPATAPRKAAAAPTKAAVKKAAAPNKVAATAKTRSARKASASRPAAAAPKTTIKAAVKAALKKTRASATQPATGPATAPRSAKAPEVKRATEVSSVVAVRGKAIGAHARSAQARTQAKRDKS